MKKQINQNREVYLNCPICKSKVFFTLVSQGKITSLITLLQLEKQLIGKKSICEKCGYEVEYNDHKEVNFLLTSKEFNLSVIKYYIQSFIYTIKEFLGV